MIAELLFPTTQQLELTSNTQLLDLEEGADVTIHSVGTIVRSPFSPLWTLYEVKDERIIRVVQRLGKSFQMLSGNYTEFSPNHRGGFTSSAKVSNSSYSPDYNTQRMHYILSQFMRRFGK